MLGNLVGCGVGALVFLMAGCTSVNTLLLTSQTFPAKASWHEVEILDRQPACEHIAIAQLSMEDSGSGNYDSEQVKILKKAATLGSDAVVFAKPEKHKEHGVSYQGPMMMGAPWGMGSYGYPGWGYGAGYYGGWGYGMGMAIPYNYTVTSLTGTAIWYTNTGRNKC